jgi:BlaI family transcriptional regulator, penicillinase repressor
MSKKLRALSGAETEILRLLWQIGRGSVQEVRDVLPASRRIGYATVQTLLRRLEAKGYVMHESRGRAHVFAPTVEPRRVITRTVGDMVDRLFGGDPVPLMLHLAGASKLSAKDVERLKDLINKSGK